MFPAIFLDRDGVLIENRSDYVRDWSQVIIFSDAIRSLSNSELKNRKIVIVTNQSAVSRGIISLETANGINARLVLSIHDLGGRIDGVYLCPHRPDDGCKCRKPMPGLLLQAAQELSLDLKRSWMIGDAWSDVQAGQAAGVQGTIIVKTGRGKDQLSISQPKDASNFHTCDDLSQAIDFILRNEDKR